MRRHLIIIILFLCNYSVEAQSLISGKVLDKNTSEPIPFAHIYVAGTSIGSISDLYGNFSLKIPDHQLIKELQISCLGFKQISIDIEKSSQPILIQLEEDIIRLEEVVITPETAQNLMKEAFAKIYDNYDTTDLTFRGYYRMESKVDTSVVRSIESILDIYKPKLDIKKSYKVLPGDSIYINEMHARTGKQIDFKLKAMVDWENTPYLLSYRDFVREFMYLDNSQEGMLDSYNFKIENIIVLQGRQTYVITVSPKKGKRKSYWNGKIFLDEETLAFSKIDVTSTSRIFKKLKRGFSYKLQSKINNVTYDSGEWKESINYQFKNGKWHLSSVNSSKYFLISSKKRGMVKTPATVTVQYKTLEVAPTKYAYDSTKYLPKRNEGYWKVEDFMEVQYDSTFWNEFDQANKNDTFLGNEQSYDEMNASDEVYNFTKLDTLQGTLTLLRTSYDVTFYHLDVEVLPEQEILKGSSLIQFKVIEPTSRIQIDLFSEMAIEKIEWQGKQLKFEREYNAVYVDFPKILEKGSVDEIRVLYSGRPVDYNPNIPMYASFLWLEDENGNPWIQAICQGYGASGWWPNKDHLSDEPDSAKISITVPSDLEVVANGRLLYEETLQNNKVRYDWAVSYSINNYNMTLNVGKYSKTTDTYDNGTTKLDLEYYMLEENQTDISVATAIVKPMLKTFEKYFGLYPFPKDGFKLVESPHPMEHQSCVSIGSEYFYNAHDSGIWSDMPATDINYSIVLHESAHEWWGNSVSCTDNSELWLHEAFATYAEALFVEDHYGYEASQDYLNRMKSQVLKRMPIVGNPDVNHIHYDISDMYTKGALVLNTLRHVIANDELWFSILKGIQSDFRHRSINTEKLIEYISKQTGTDYTYFFDQYLRTTNVPELEIKSETVMGIATLNYRWSGTQDDFVMPVDYRVGNELKRLYPNTKWSKIPVDLTNGFEVNTSQFYVELKIN
jgi:hypothetical protein